MSPFLAGIFQCFTFPYKKLKLTYFAQYMCEIYIAGCVYDINLSTEVNVLYICEMILYDEGVIASQPTGPLYKLHWWWEMWKITSSQTAETRYGHECVYIRDLVLAGRLRGWLALERVLHSLIGTWHWAAWEHGLFLSAIMILWDHIETGHALWPQISK